jgi:hypothetical protein
MLVLVAEAVNLESLVLGIPINAMTLEHRKVNYSKLWRVDFDWCRSTRNNNVALQPPRSVQAARFMCFLVLGSVC